jgi:hypothetical protein
VARALPDLIARIRLDSSGVDESLAGLTKSFSRTNLEMGLAAAGIAGIFAIGKSFIDITEAQDAAQSDLAQAYHGTAEGLKNYRAQIADFIDGNQAFIKDQAAVIEGFAVLTRQGLSVTQTTRDMGIALDLAATQHVSLAQAVDLVQNAEAGRFRGLLKLGINIKGVTAANQDNLASADAIANAMIDLQQKEEGGRQTTSKLEQEQNKLGAAWDHLARDAGPPLLDTLTWGTTKAAEFLDALGDPKKWAGISNFFVNLAKDIQFAIGAIPKSQQSSQSGFFGIPEELPPPAAPGAPTKGQRASGGPVMPNGIYTVGEHGPETLVMGARGGMVLPNSQQGAGSSQMVVLPFVFSPIPPNAAQLAAINEGLRQLNRQYK